MSTPAVKLAPTQDDIQTVLRSFLLAVLGSDFVAVEGQDNRVAQPGADDFVTFWPTRRDRLSTNVDTYVDCQFTGALADATLTVSAVAFGALVPGRLVYGPGVAAGTTIVSGPGGVGNYVVTPGGQTVSAEKMASGVVDLLQPTGLTMQLDVHGTNSADNAQRISTAFRSLWGADFFRTTNASVAPLYADDPIQLPFTDGEQQIENRWKIDARLQVQQTIEVGQQFADTVTVDRVPVDEFYPA